MIAAGSHPAAAVDDLSSYHRTLLVGHGTASHGTGRRRRLFPELNL